MVSVTAAAAAAAAVAGPSGSTFEAAMLITPTVIADQQSMQAPAGMFSQHSNIGQVSDDEEEEEEEGNT